MPQAHLSRDIVLFEMYLVAWRENIALLSSASLKKKMVKADSCDRYTLCVVRKVY